MLICEEFLGPCRSWGLEHASGALSAIAIGLVSPNPGTLACRSSCMKFSPQPFTTGYVVRPEKVPLGPRNLLGRYHRFRDAGCPSLASRGRARIRLRRAFSCKSPYFAPAPPTSGVLPERHPDTPPAGVKKRAAKPFFCSFSRIRRPADRAFCICSHLQVQFSANPETDGFSHLRWLEFLHLPVHRFVTGFHSHRFAPSSCILAMGRFFLREHAQKNHADICRH